MEAFQRGQDRRGADSDKAIKRVLLGISSLAVLIVLLIILFTFENSLKAFGDIGIVDFILGGSWLPSNGDYGALPLIAGTLLVTLGAMAIAVPLGIACALYISEIAKPKSRTSLKPAVEIFSAIPSVVFGFVGMMMIIPTIKTIFPDQQLFSNSWLAASIVLALMALPTIVSVSEDAIHSVPRSYREASLAMGATRWETIVKVVIPAATSGVSAAIILGVGRAIGETMAVLMLTGNSPLIPEPLWNVFSLISTLTGTIALELPEAVSGSLAQSSLFGLGVILMVIVIIINYFSRRVIRRANAKAGMGVQKRSMLSRIVPVNVREAIEERKGKILKASIFILVAVIAWMFSSLLVDDLAAIAVAATCACLVVGAGAMLDKMDRVTKETICIDCLTWAMYAVIVMLVGIIGFVVINGLPALSWEFLTTNPTNAGRSGGIMPAIVGTLELLAGTALVAFPLGILTGIYLNEYARDTGYTRLIRRAIDLLNGTPSIVFGMFGMVVLVMHLGLGYSMLAGWITLAFMILPVIIRTTEEAMKSVPKDLREASRALGATKWQTIYKVVVPAAMGGIVTGSILSMGRAAGETAPIMLTAAVISQPSLAGSVFEPVMALPLHLYHLAMDLPGTTALQYGTATVLLLIVLVIFGVASLVRSYYSKKVRW